MMVSQQTTQVSMQYQSISISSKQETTEQTGSIKEDFSLNARYASYMFQSSGISSGNVSAQSALSDMVGNSQQMRDFLGGLGSEGMLSLKDLGYEGKPILELNPNEASALLSGGGFFSVENTAGRAIDFVLAGVGDDLEKLQAGREGIVKGFADAEKMWGGRLPDIAYETQKLTLEKIDEKIQSLGGNALNIAA